MALVVTRGRLVGTYLIGNLSEGGALVTGPTPLAVGTGTLVLLQLPGERPIVIRGRVVRQTAHSMGFALAVAFDPMGEQACAGLREAVRRRLEDEGSLRRRVLIVDDSREVLRALARDLDRLKCEAVSATSLAEARQRLIEAERGPDPPLHAAIVDLCLGPEDGCELLALLAEEYPAVWRVLISGQVAPWQLELARVGRYAHHVLCKPWDRAALAEAIK